MDKVWSWIEKNRFVVIGPIVAMIIWLAGASCTPQTISPLDPSRQVTAQGLELDYKIWQSEQEIIAARFELAGQDLQEQKDNNKKIEDMILALASGGVADLPGLLKLLMTGGGLGALIDNIRKRGVIAGLKRNK